MKDALVKDYMTSPVISISGEVALSEARRMMMDRKVRRLPVVAENKLVGIVSLTDVLEAKPAAPTSLSFWELNQQIANMKVRDIMVTEVFSINQNATIADAARMMLEHNFSGIPVASHGKLIGMITESDIFRILASDGKYLSIRRQQQWRSGAAANA
ncbi:MAG: CBS domain-containing protein [Pseudomonadales bacterium]